MKAACENKTVANNEKWKAAAVYFSVDLLENEAFSVLMGRYFFDRVECHERTKTTRALAIAFQSSIHLQVLAIIDD